MGKNPAAQLAAQRVKVLKPCAHCLKPKPMLKIQKYCGEQCKQAAKYLRTLEKTHGDT